jgi:hemolysin III
LYTARVGIPEFKSSLQRIGEYSRTEHRLDAVVHVAGILLAINASLWLIAQVVSNYTGLSVVISVSVYCAGLLAMILASAGYNLSRHPRSREILRRLDHAAIFIMIAATYTPFAANRLGGATGTALLAAIWLSATAGVALKFLAPRRFEKVSIALYLAMGWMVLAVIQPLAASVATVDFWLLIAGGLVYSAGVAFHVIERIPFHKAIWHALVLVAAALHFIAIAAEFAV